MLSRLFRPGSPLWIGGLVFALLILAGSVVITAVVMAAWQPRQAAAVTPLPSETLSPSPPAPPPPTPLPTHTPFPSTSTLTLTPASPLATPTPLIYVVVQGDTLSAIAYRFGVTVEAIRQANGLSSDLIYPGQALLIPVGGVNLVGTPLAPGITSTAVEAVTIPPGNITPTARAAFVTHLVQPGETLDGIAAQYGLLPQDLRLANFMVGDALLPGQKLNIPPAPPQVAEPFHFSIVSGNMAANYPLSLETERFTLHFQPRSFTSVDPQAVAQLVSNGLTHLELLFQVSLPGRFDVYAAGSVFYSPERALRGRSFSAARYYVFLHDGSGNATDQQYIATHELTHLFTWNVFGIPVTTMLSEGAAVYGGMQLIADSAHLPLDTFCAAYLQAGVLPRVSASLSFGGHNLDLENYYAAGCFVGYLVETYGPAKFGQLYPTADYAGIYGKSLAGLEQDWRAALAAQVLPPDLDAVQLVATVEHVEAAYLSFFSAFRGTNQQLLAYRELDLARLALLEGRLADAEAQLKKYQEVLNSSNFRGGAALNGFFAP